MFRLATAALVALAASAASVVVDAVLPAGVCYSPFHSPDYTQNAVGALLERDFKDIATKFSSVRTYHAQFYGTNVVSAAKAAGIKVAIGIQMLGADGRSAYPYLENDIQAAIWAAQNEPNSVLAIYAGNENLVNGATSADAIINVINRIKGALRGTAGERVPVGTVQRLEEWLHAPDADRLAGACDVLGGNIYPFFTSGAESNMKSTLENQWNQFAGKYPGKARLTETGWPTAGSDKPFGNTPNTDNAQKYFNAFVEWTAQTPTEAPFYFMMYDVSGATGPDYEQHFGIATSYNQMKIQFDAGSAPVAELREESGMINQVEVLTPAPSTDAPTPEPTTETPAPTTPSTPTPTETPSVTPATLPIESSSSGSGGADEIVVPETSVPHEESSSSGFGIADGSEDAGNAPAPTDATSAPAPATVAPGVADKTPEQILLEQQEQAAREASSRVARDVAGNNSKSLFALAGVVGVAGIVAMVVITVYMRRRNNVDEETRTVATSIDPRGSTPSVYDDPLGTRFSSIVMITPNGDGVCIL